MKNANGIMFINKHNKKYLTWVEMAPAWVNEANQAYVQRDAYQLIVDIITLKEYNINTNDYLIVCINDNRIIRVVDLERTIIA